MMRSVRERHALATVDLELQRRIQRRAARVHLELAPPLLQGLVTYYALLQRWNTRINLTALTTADEALDRLLLEPVIAARYLPPGSRSLMDLGSGGGSPAIPLKLSAPAISLWMVESKTRKSAFLREAVRQIPLTNTIVETTRFENLLSNPGYHERMDVLSMRAVRCDAGTLAQVAPLVHPGGHFLLFTTEIEVARLFDTGGWHLIGSEPLLPALRSRLAIFRRAS